jgi:hypothetical protein
MSGLSLILSFAFLISPEVGLSYARQYALQRDYETSLLLLNLNRPTNLNYFYYRGIAEYSLNMKAPAEKDLLLVVDSFRTNEVPVRYVELSYLMLEDMKIWKTKDLGDISRQMNDAKRSLDLNRITKAEQTQKNIISRLDELIKKMENQAKSAGEGNKPQQCPSGGSSPGKDKATGQEKGFIPQPDSIGGNDKGKGKVDEKKLTGLAKEWGKLPEKERVKATQELIKDMPAEYRELIENYFRKLAQRHD